MKLAHWILVALSSALLGLILSSWLAKPSTDTDTTQSALAIPVSLFAIQQTEQQRFSFDPNKSLNIAYFGFTNCPDVCPTSLAMLSAALDVVEPSLAEQVQGLFISLDPERDDASKAQQYAAYFHPSFIGLSPHEGQLLGLSQMLGVYYKYVNMDDSALEYSVDHNSFFYFFDNQGTLLGKVPHTLEPDPLVQKIQTLLKD